MGFDLYSLGNHKTKKGEYFRNNVWWWRPLADFVCEKTGVVSDEDKSHWHHNDGHEVSEQEAKQIAKQLKELVKNGEVSKAIKVLKVCHFETSSCKKLYCSRRLNERKYCFSCP